MSDDRLNAIMDRYRDAGIKRDARDAELRNAQRQAENIEAKARRSWEALQDTIRRELEALNGSLSASGYRLHHGTEHVDDQYIGQMSIAFRPISYRMGQLDILRIVALRTGTLNITFGTAHQSPVGGDRDPIEDFDAERIRKVLLDFLEKNVPQ